MIWDPVLDLFVDEVHDYPCTLSLQFMVRGGKLVLHTTMRSNDVWKGTTYDVFMFTQLQQMIATALDLEAGPYYHHANSFHLYESDEGHARVLLDSIEDLALPLPIPVFFGPLMKRGTQVEVIMDRARALLKHETWESNLDNEIVAQWYLEQMAKLT
jgi:thymidylate synthase